MTNAGNRTKAPATPRKSAQLPSSGEVQAVAEFPCARVPRRHLPEKINCRKFMRKDAPNAMPNVLYELRGLAKFGLVS